MSERTRIGAPYTSAHREAILINNAAFVDGVCHAIDELHELGETAAAERLFARLFRQPVTDVPEEAGQ